MKERDKLKRRILICKAIVAFQIAFVIASMIFVWNPPQQYRHLIDALWYASLFAHAGLLLFLGKCVTHAKEELEVMNHSADL